MSPRKSKSPQPLRLVTGSAAEKATERWPWEDSDLVAAVQAGDPAVASVLCDRLWPQVDRTIRRLLGRADADHDDIAQISLIEIVKTIGRYRGECSLDRWAQAVTAHVVFKHIRGKSAERRAFANLLDDDSFSVPAGFDRRLLVRQLLDRITGHLDQMNEPRAWAFLLHDALGYDLQEVAEMTGISVAAAQSRLSRGRRELHERLGRDPELAELLRVEGGE